MQRLNEPYIKNDVKVATYHEQAFHNPYYIYANLKNGTFIPNTRALVLLSIYVFN